MDTYQNEGNTPFWYAVFRGGGRGLDGTQYAKCPFAVRINSVISYANIIFLVLKGQLFIKKHNKIDIQSEITLSFSRSRFARAVLGSSQYVLNINIDFGRSKTGNSNKKTQQS